MVERMGNIHSFEPIIVEVLVELLTFFSGELPSAQRMKEAICCDEELGEQFSVEIIKVCLI